MVHKMMTEIGIIYDWCPKCWELIYFPANVNPRKTAVDCDNCNMIIECDMWPNYDPNDLDDDVDPLLLYRFGCDEVKERKPSGSVGYINGNDELVIDTWNENGSWHERWDFRFDGVAICIDGLIADNCYGVRADLFDDLIGESGAIRLEYFEQALSSHIKKYS